MARTHPTGFSGDSAMNYTDNAITIVMQLKCCQNIRMSEIAFFSPSLGCLKLRSAHLNWQQAQPDYLFTPASVALHKLQHNTADEKKTMLLLIASRENPLERVRSVHHLAMAKNYCAQIRNGNPPV